MNPLILGLVALRAAALALSLTGNSKGAQVLYAAADAAEAGVNIDAHMAAVAQRLKAGEAITDADWDDVLSRIKADSDRLQGS